MGRLHLRSNIEIDQDKNAYLYLFNKSAIQATD